MASNLLIFLKINWPQCVKCTAKFGGLATIWGACVPSPPAPPQRETATAYATSYQYWLMAYVVTSSAAS